MKDIAEAFIGDKVTDAVVTDILTLMILKDKLQRMLDKLLV